MCLEMILCSRSHSFALVLSSGALCRSRSFALSLSAPVLALALSLFALSLFSACVAQDTLAASPAVSQEELLGKIDPASHPAFTAVPASMASREGMFLRTEVLSAFTAMRDSAKKDGVNLIILSATRSFAHQRSIWEKKWVRSKYAGWSDEQKALDILKYSSMPGTSRHHWGTDLDINSLEPAYFASGQGKKIYDWMCAHAADFGFCQTYTSKSSGRTGYEEEHWHWSYYPLSEPFLEAYLRTITPADLTGFSGYAAAASIDVIGKYVRGIECHQK
jgi:zinc D-Ala-D-Ala carboxypeptidase